jgi:hypothetical protein
MLWFDSSVRLFTYSSSRAVSALDKLYDEEFGTQTDDLIVKAPVKCAVGRRTGKS